MIRKIAPLALIIVTIVALGFTSASSQHVDTVSSASVKYYYGPAATIQEIAAVTTNGIVVVSTTNLDGTPNAAVVIPGVFEEKYLVFALADNQTKVNLERGGEAVVTIFLPSPDPAKNTGKYGDVRKYGARLFCTIVMDPVEKGAVVERYNAAQPAGGRKLTVVQTQLLRIDQITPIG